jgi:hypothetical protein
MEQKFGELLKAAELGNADAMFQLSELYRLGNGVEKDDNKAEEWLRKAAESGHVKAKSKIENRDSNKEDAAKNKAMGWFNKATEKVNATVKAATEKATEQVNATVKAAADAKAKAEAEIRSQVDKAQAPAIKQAVNSQTSQDPMLGTYFCKKYNETIIFDSSTHAIEINAGVNRKLGTVVRRELSVTVNGDNVTLNETSNNYSTLSKAQWDECFLPLAMTYKGSFNSKKTVLQGYWHHQSGHTSSHFVYDKVK